MGKKDGSNKSSSNQVSHRYDRLLASCLSGERFLSDEEIDYIGEVVNDPMFSAKDIISLVNNVYQFILFGVIRTKSILMHASRDNRLENYKKVFHPIIMKKLEQEKPKVTQKVKHDIVKLLMLLIGITGLSKVKSTNNEVDELLRIAASDESVLITGETGTGKELHAMLMHYLSPRIDEPFFAINCAGLPETIIESELFGHKRGSFTGATDDHIGLFEEVKEGTLFLDEIGDMPLLVQSKLLRVLETRDFFRVGDYEVRRHFKGRVIAATNKNLLEEIHEKNFRGDLYYRLAVMDIKLKPLRERIPEELEMIILDILARIVIPKDDALGIKMLKTLTTSSGNYEGIITKEAMDQLRAYQWTGNFRELWNVLKRAYHAATPHPITAEHFNLPQDKSTSGQITQNHSVNIRNIELKNIIDYAEEEKRKIIRGKLEQVFHDRSDLKNELHKEGLTTPSQYSNFRNKLDRILGTGELAKIRKQCG